MKKIIIFTISIFLLLFISIYFINIAGESIETLSRYGSSGEEVKKIQQKLKDWGYYKGNVDGVYGSKTQSAVKAFQKANGLTADRNSWAKNIRGNSEYPHQEEIRQTKLQVIHQI